MIGTAAIFAIGGVAIVALVIAAGFALRGWQGWLELKKLELAQEMGNGLDRGAPPSGGGRIELAGHDPTSYVAQPDLKERVRKLEAIAAGIDL